MKVIVCGAGQVGLTIARHLSHEGIDVTLVDIDPEQAQRADENYDVRGMVGHAAHPHVLERAGARDADLLIAVTRSDEVNMVACQVAYSLFNVPRRLARIRHQGYLEDIWRGLYANDQLPIDVIISPEVEVADGIERRLRTPGAFDTVTLAQGRVQLLGIHCNTSHCRLVGRTLSEIAEELPEPLMVVVAIMRAGEAFVPNSDDSIAFGDDVYVVTQPKRIPEVMAFFGHEEKVARRVVIVGGGNVGLNLARRLSYAQPGMSLKLIEFSRERAEMVAREMGDRVVVLQGDALDRETLLEATIQSAETIVAVTNDDETNIFASVLAKREGCERAITLVNKTSYAPILPTLGIDVVVSPNSITISSILQHVRHRCVAGLYTLREDFGEVIEAKVQPESKLAGSTLEKIKLPEGMMIGAIARDEEVILPCASSLIKAGDTIIAMVKYSVLHDAEALLSGRSFLFRR
jgi:trk system potassium uptake protein TrkA